MFTRAVHMLPILNQVNPVRITQSYFPKIHLNILKSHLRVGPPSGLFLSDFPAKPYIHSSSF